ncbi:hypothetical protein HD806DRAFT_488679 [Xylariaceae sp. AK1471]|nr:hypothetical protein HD806DRAFT_488679 [Xylariaceae sp. AK1471]
MATEEEQRRLGHEVANYFTQNPRLEFVGFAGLGRHGGALLLEEKGESKTDQGRKLVVKYSLGGLSNDKQRDSDDDLRNEYRWLKMLRGAEHIVKLVDLADCSLQLPGISDGEETYEESVRRTSSRDQKQTAQGATTADGKAITQEPPTVRKCPTFALEYLPGGTLFKFYQRIGDEGEWVPNRLLWRIWLCMVRQVVAMAFPPNIPENLYNGQEERERIVPDKEFFTLTQNSAHLDNFLFGEVNPGKDADHNPGAPTVKLIDFGRGTLEGLKDWEREGLTNPYEGACRLNTVYAAMAFMRICCPFDDDDQLEMLPEGKGVWYHYMKNGTAQKVLTEAPWAMRSHEMMDRQLRDIIVRCFAADFSDIPSLREILDDTEAAVASRGPNDDPNLADLMEVEETDDYLVKFVQKFIYEPDV